MRSSSSLAILMIINLALAAVLAALWLQPDGHLRQAELHWQAPKPQRVDFAAMVPAVPASAAEDTGRFLALLERPLFSKSRRPPVPEPVVAVARPPGPPPPPPVDLLSSARVQAIIDIPGEGGFIIMNVAGKSRRVALKSSIEGWTAASITDRAVTFVRNGQSRTLQMQRAALTRDAGARPSSPASPSASPSQSRPRSVISRRPAESSPSTNEGPQQAPPTSTQPQAPLVPVFGGS